jgi:DNA-binding HxlR family transcriptional regulator
MVTIRSYEDGCAAAHALDLIGERWALLVVRELLLGPKRFTDLRGAATLNQEQIDQVIRDEDTKLPDHLQHL